MSEDFLHYIWKFQLFNSFDFKTTSNDQLDILNVGIHNRDAGPDFLNGKIKLDNLIWNGAIEIHIKSSDWIQHKHQEDLNYDNVILHVVYEHDLDLFRSDDTLIPTLEIKNLIANSALQNYNSLINSKSDILCEKFIKNIQPLTIESTKERALIERLEEKSILLNDRLIELNNNWEQLTYERMGYCLGLKINAENFETLTRNTPINTLLKHKDNLFQLEAILFGQAGYLEDEIENEYHFQLAKEYLFLKTKYSLLTPLKEHNWKLLRLRPASFPTLRIALFASMIQNYNSLFSLIKNTESLKELYLKLQTETSSYWQNHYTFNNKSSKENKKNLSKGLFELIVINAVIPILFLYSKKKNSDEIKNKCLDILSDIKPENNKITRFWQELSISNKTAFDSQSLIQLYNSSCKLKKCLDCSIGSTIIQKNKWNI